MNLLLITNRCPFPPIDGYTIAVCNMLRGIIESGIQVTLLSMNTKRHFQTPEDIDAKYSNLCQCHYIYVDNRIKYSAAFLNLFSSDSYNIVRFYSKDFEHALTELLKSGNFDLVQLEGLNLCLYIDAIRKSSKARIVLRAHNVEYLIWERLAAGEMNYFRKKYFKLLAGRLKNFETNQMARIDALIPITGQDASIFRIIRPDLKIKVAPLGIYPDEYPFSRAGNKDISLFHLGALNWKPTVQGLLWFFGNVWPEVNRRFKDLKFYIAGRQAARWFTQMNFPGAVISGEVKDAIEFMKKYQVMLVPLLAGSGIRVKIIEAMAMGKTIISTRIGCEGIDVTDGVNILIADSKDEFIDKIRLCINDPSTAEQIGVNARKRAEEKYNNRKISAEVAEFYIKVLE